MAHPGEVVCTFDDTHTLSLDLDFDPASGKTLVQIVVSADNDVIDTLEFLPAVAEDFAWAIIDNANQAKSMSALPRAAVGS